MSFAIAMRYSRRYCNRPSFLRRGYLPKTGIVHQKIKVRPPLLIVLRRIIHLLNHRPMNLAVASAPAVFRVRVWQVMSRGRLPGAGHPPLEGARVGYPGYPHEKKVDRSRIVAYEGNALPGVENSTGPQTGRPANKLRYLQHWRTLGRAGHPIQ
jgi:hypothetical protein